MFEIQFGDPEGEPPALLGASWYRVVRDVDRETFIRYLKDRGIRCQYVVTDEYDDSSIYLSESGTEVFYEFPEDDELHLNQITVSDSGPGNRRFRDC